MVTHLEPDNPTGELVWLNDLPEAEARSLLQRCLAVPRWVDEMLAGRPYDGLADIVARSRLASSSLTETEVEAALARHPRIGERAGAGHDAELSGKEQSGIALDDDATAAALRAGNEAYEERFGRVFLIRAAGRSAGEILAELTRRLGNTREAETAEVVEQLAEIAALRLGQVLENEASVRGERP